jgi:hypothetical protein
VSNLMFSLSGGVVAVVFSLLFLVVPYANTNLTPRLTLFREDPAVWGSFAFFVAVFVYCAIAGIVLSNDDEVSFLVPVVALLLVLVALGAIRTLHFRAYRSLRLGATLSDITAQGSACSTSSARMCRSRPSAGESSSRRSKQRCVGPAASASSPRSTYRGWCASPLLPTRWWSSGSASAASCAVASSSLRSAAVPSVSTTPACCGCSTPPGIARSIRIRCSPSGGVHELLHSLVGRDLDIGHIGVDELSTFVGHSPQARQRLVEMVDDLIAEASPSRRASLATRQQVLAGSG